MRRASKSIIHILRLGFLVFSINPISQAANWYVSQSIAASGNGQSWATAWKNSKNIQWGSIQAGDIIYFDGGSSGYSYEAFNTITANGTSSNYITIARSLEPGRDGFVTFATPCLITGNYIKFDGGSFKQVSGTTYRCGIVFTCNRNQYVGQIPGGASIAVTGAKPWFRYCYFNGDYSAGSGHTFGAENSTGFTLDRCWFYQSSFEDQWVYRASASGANVDITNSVFQEPNNAPQAYNGECDNPTDHCHRDIANPWTGSGGWNLNFVGNIVFNTDKGAPFFPQGDGLLLQVPAKLGTVFIANNVCYNTARFVAFGSANGGVNVYKYYNNTTLDTTYAPYSETHQSPAPAPDIKNHLGSNISNPNFKNSSNPIGVDGIPFTSDDGFNLNSNSSAIGQASVLSDVPTDILGASRGSSPDLGAYEFGAISPPPSNPHPADSNTDYLMALNEATKYGACWKNPATFGDCPAGISIDYAVRAGTLWAATANGQYQYNTANPCPLCWEIKP